MVITLPLLCLFPCTQSVHTTGYSATGVSTISEAITAQTPPTASFPRNCLERQSPPQQNQCSYWLPHRDLSHAARVNLVNVGSLKPHLPPATTGAFRPDILLTSSTTMQDPLSRWQLRPQSSGQRRNAASSAILQKSPMYVPTASSHFWRDWRECCRRQNTSRLTVLSHILRR